MGNTYFGIGIHGVCCTSDAKQPCGCFGVGWHAAICADCWWASDIQADVRKASETGKEDAMNAFQLVLAALVVGFVIFVVIVLGAAISAAFSALCKNCQKPGNTENGYTDNKKIG